MTTRTLPPPTKHMVLEQIKTVIETVDRHAREVNVRWGFNRLPHLVPVKWAEGFAKQKRAWETACFECAGSLSPADLERVRTEGATMIRAYDKLATIATEQGETQYPPTRWEFELKDGTPVVLVRDRSELAQVDLGGRKGQVWSLDEIADVIAKFPDIARAKECFPGAEVIQLRTEPLVVGKLNDELADLPGFG